MRRRGVDRMRRLRSECTRHSGLGRPDRRKAGRVVLRKKGGVLAPRGPSPPYWGGLGQTHCNARFGAKARRPDGGNWADGKGGGGVGGRFGLKKTPPKGCRCPGFFFSPATGTPPL